MAVQTGGCYDDTLLQTYLGEIVRASDERHSDVGRQIVVRMPRCDAADNARFPPLKLMSDERQSWPISSANKIGRQKSVVCHAIIGRICLLLKLSDFIVQVEHVLFSTRKSPNFLECRAVIGQQSVYTTNL